MSIIDLITFTVKYFKFLVAQRNIIALAVAKAMVILNIHSSCYFCYFQCRFRCKHLSLVTNVSYVFFFYIKCVWLVFMEIYINHIYYSKLTVLFTC